MTSGPTEATPHDGPPMPNRATSRWSHRSRTAWTPAWASRARFVAESSSSPGAIRPCGRALKASATRRNGSRSGPGVQ
jgi:hypothetical protein